MKRKKKYSYALYPLKVTWLYKIRNARQKTKKNGISQTGSYLKTPPASEILEWGTTGGSENRQTRGGTLSDNTQGLLALDCAVIAPFIKRMY